MTAEALASLIHEVREALDRAPIRSGVYDAIVGEVRVAQFIAEHSSLDEAREGVNRSILELALRNVLTRRELERAHDPAKRALRVVLSREDARKIDLPPASPLMGDSSVGVDVDLALVHLGDAVKAVRDFQEGDSEKLVTSTLIEKLEGVAGILRRLHQEFAA